MITLTANSSIYAGYCVSLCLTTQERVELTDWNNFQSVANVLGVATNDAMEGADVLIQDSGIYENVSWTFTYAKPVYVFAMGTVTQDLPPKNVIQIGKAVSPTKLLIKISEFIQVKV